MAESPVQHAGPRMKYTLTHYRQQQHTHEAFIKWIVDEHLPVAMPIFKKHGILGYSLFVTPPLLNESIKQEIRAIRPSWDFADYDCIIEYIVPDMEAIRNVIMDPDWQAAIKDQDDWVDTAKALVSLGYSTPYLVETGEVVNMTK